MFVQGGPRPHIPFPPDLILYVNLVAKGAPKFFKTLAPRLTVLDIPYFADAYSCTVRPVDLHNFNYFKGIHQVDTDFNSAVHRWLLIRVNYRFMGVGSDYCQL